MDPDPAERLRATAREALRDAMRAREGVAVEALRSLLGAIDNAEAADPADAPTPEAGRIAGGVAGLGAGEVRRRVLDEGEVRGILDDAVAEREAAAAQYDRLGRPDDANRLRTEVAVLQRLSIGG
jgi:uncharacterized protein